jgi:predicted phosphodiesterase
MPDTPFPIPEVSMEYSGVLFIGDPHISASAPGFRSDDYCETVLRKLDFCLKTARDRRCLPIILGDLFHVPRDNPNALLVSLIELFRTDVPWVLVGNHDKHEARLTRDVSLSVLNAAGAIRLLDTHGTVASLNVRGRKVLIGASPDWTPLPSGMDGDGFDFVVWVTHHDLSFPGYESGRVSLREIPGIDLVVNGHIHTPKPPQRVGRTLWANPGSIVRICRTQFGMDMKPALSIWIPESDELERVEIPHSPFEEVFSLPGEGENPEYPVDESMFIRGLENLALRRTSEGVGLRAFLQANLNQENPVDQLVWEIYEEIMNHGEEDR